MLARDKHSSLFLRALMKFAALSLGRRKLYFLSKNLLEERECQDGQIKSKVHGWKEKGKRLMRQKN